MIAIPLLFWLLMLTCCGYAIVFGGKDGRWASGMIVAAAILTIPALLIGRKWHEPEWALFLVDLALLAGFYALMLKSRRYWPIWMTGFHLVAVTSHLSALAAASYAREIYRAVETFWALPVLIVMLIGVAKDRSVAARAEGPVC